MNICRKQVQVLGAQPHALQSHCVIAYQRQEPPAVKSSQWSWPLPEFPAQKLAVNPVNTIDPGAGVTINRRNQELLEIVRLMDGDTSLSSWGYTKACVLVTTSLFKDRDQGPLTLDAHQGIVMAELTSKPLSATKSWGWSYPERSSGRDSSAKPSTPPASLGQGCTDRPENQTTPPGFCDNAFCCSKWRLPGHGHYKNSIVHLLSFLHFSSKHYLKYQAMQFTFWLLLAL